MSLLIADEVGILSLGSEDAALLFEVVCCRHERGSNILTFNKNYAPWVESSPGTRSSRRPSWAGCSITRAPSSPQTGRERASPTASSRSPPCPPTNP
ncbi:MAG: ATP-binding protein, partial [Thermoleophilia bacterium]